MLYQLAKDFEEVFECNNLANFSSTNSWSGEEGKRLIISSSAVRQFLVLRYNLLLGKKSKNIIWNIEANQKNYRELLSAFILSEGSFSQSNRQLRFEFKIQDACVRNSCHKCLKLIGCDPKKSKNQTFNTGIYSADDILKLYHFIQKELFNTRIHLKIREMIDNLRILYKVKKLKLCEYVNQARNELSNSQPNKEFVKSHDRLFSHIEKINHARVSSWALGKVPAPLSAMLI